MKDPKKEPIVRVKESHSLFKDKRTGAVVRQDSLAYRNVKKARKIQKRERERTERLERMVNALLDERGYE